MKRLPAEHEPVLREALLERLQTIEELTAFDSPPAEATPQERSDPSDEEEERLRELMVHSLKGLEGATDSEIITLFNELGEIRMAAHSEDLRYLDAYNLAFERLREHRPDTLGESTGREFLRAYQKVLTYHTERLGHE